jgi:hypothetical protein
MGVARELSTVSASRGSGAGVVTMRRSASECAKKQVWRLHLVPLLQMLVRNLVGCSLQMRGVA